MKYLAALISIAVLLVSKRSFVATSPLHGQDIHQRGLSLAGLNLPSKDTNVRDLERLKPVGNLAVVKTHSSVYTNINGKQKQLAQTKEEVDKDGVMLARVEQQIDKSSENGEPHIKTSLDIPSKNIHKVIETRPQKEENEIERDQGKGFAGLQYGPADMAEYVFWTGDEKGVTSAIEEYLQEGMMSRMEAIDFLQEIKKNLELLQSQYMDQPPVYGANTKAFSKDDRSYFTKKSQPDFGNTLGMVPSSIGASLTEEDYEDLVDRLKLSDLLYNEYSLEEVIYQLSKVMFTQSLSRGSVEAQDALQKVTGFLDSEAQQGRISRVLEKKVLAVLISALSDTLTEHPELVNTARESLGIPQPEPLFSQVFSNQLNKQAVSQNDDSNGHRFHMSNNHLKRTIKDSGLEDSDPKKSAST